MLLPLVTCGAWQQPQRLHTPLVRLHGWMHTSHDSNNNNNNDRGKQTSLERWAQWNSERNEMFHQHNINNNGMMRNDRRDGNYRNDYPPLYDEPHHDRMHLPEEREQAEEYGRGMRDSRFDSPPFLQQRHPQEYPSHVDDRRQDWNRFSNNPNYNNYSPYNKKRNIHQATRRDNGQNWNDNHWVNDNKKDSQHEIIGPEQSSGSNGPVVSGASSPFWSSPPRQGLASPYRERYGPEYDDSFSRFPMTSNRYEDQQQQPPQQRGGNNRWSPSTFSYPPRDYDDRMRTMRTSPPRHSPTPAEYNRHWSPRSMSGWNRSSSSSSSEYQRGVTEPISSESFQNSINNHMTIGPEPEWERRRRMQKQRLQGPHNTAHVDMTGQFYHEEDDYNSASYADPSPSYDDYALVPWHSRNMN